ncbi:ACP S-malonyltransferase [Legionella sp. km772]|uniref:ACP S-malonyltransferase n=1 Tax=Legionella sp. km772 TaxID=2498111 RepID=UPI000F8DB111|nr:ACP S-malonyltransferase [Legionella sp. km772]RUR11134.1 [acyl-carrier-protein] S-malonyltransferase [Legionella sp. km772]
MMTAYLFPGQGSQKLGMGAELFPLFPELVEKAEQILGYSLVDLCLHDSHKQLNNTAFTQPALYVVNALSYLKKINEAEGKKPDYFLGHSLGEYNALWAAGVFDFETGLILVQKRGQLMSQAVNGCMAAVIGLSSNQVASILANNNLSELAIANYNSYLQQVISGPSAAISKAKEYFINAGAKLYLLLAVTGAFHSSLMEAARLEFTEFLAPYHFSAPELPVIANLNAQPYQAAEIHQTLALQIDHPVQWLQSIRYLVRLSEDDFQEVGPGKVLTNLIVRINDGQ